MTIAIIAIIIGFIGLIWSADQFVEGAAGIARNLGMAPIMIGLTVVAFGTSAPEIIVAISASMENASPLAVGNALGSNIANIGLVLSITALVSPIPISKSLPSREIPILLLATIAVGFFLVDNELSFVDGVVFLLGLAGILIFLVSSKSHQPNAATEADVEHIPNVPIKKAWLLFFIGLILLIGSSHILVYGAKEIAIYFHVSELIIGLTIVAVGTSLPELAATVASALKGHHDVALGNIIGSNLFNLLAVMAMPAIINPPTLDPVVFNRDYMWMTGITLILAAIILLRHWQSVASAKRGDVDLTATTDKYRIGRPAGAFLLCCYIAYYYVLF